LGDLIFAAGRDALCEKATGRARSVFPYMRGELYGGSRGAAKVTTQFYPAESAQKAGRMKRNLEARKPHKKPATMQISWIPVFQISLPTASCVIHWRTNVI
jgi:hypothetical protein